MDENGNTKDDLSLPKGTDDAEKLAQQIKEDFDAGKELVVTVLKVRMSPGLHLHAGLCESFPVTGGQLCYLSAPRKFTVS